jgi:PAS domain S-box-containing protein
MSKIAYIAPDDEMYQMAKRTLVGEYQDILIEKGLLTEGVRTAQSLIAQGVDVIIARGGTAEAIRKAGLPVSLVEIPYAGFDLIRAVKDAMRYGSVIGIVAFSSMVLGVECLGPILGITVCIYTINDESEAESQVLQAFADGVDVVVGGVITALFANKHQLPHVLIDTGVESMLQAAQEAKRIAAARQHEQEKSGLFQAMLDYAYEGIISVDHAGDIRLFNPVAERITKVQRADALGKKITAICPEFALEDVLHSAKEELGQFLHVHEIDILCNKVPIIVDGHTVGAVATFQEVSQIQQMEAAVRKRIYASGHVATLSFSDIVGTSKVIEKTVAVAKRYAKTDSAILISGETGTGKEVFAQSIHNQSNRRNGPFVAINCAALPSQILESELFGYVGGAFTGASQKGKIGLFELAHCGTIFLDEVSEIDYATQGKLLRVLQEKKVMRLGSDRVLPVDVRVIAATNKNLKELIQEKKFRPDLYYRLNVLQLRLHPLRERTEDVKALARFFLKKITDGSKNTIKLSSSAITALSEYAWPGNVRELKNVLERIVAVLDSDIIDGHIVRQVLADDQQEDIRHYLLTQEYDEIRKALTIAKGNYSDAAKMLGISRTTLWRKLRYRKLPMAQ